MSEDYARGVKGEIDQRPLRFYTDVATAEAEGGWVVKLDGRLLRTPGGLPLAAPTQALAEVVAGEWRGQGERIDLASMFATRLAHVALDRTPDTRAELIDEAARYAETDLVCHLAEGPAELVGRQEAYWAPLRAWSAAALGVRLVPVTGIMAPRQPAESFAAIRRHAGGLDDFRLTGLVYGVSLFGSAVLGLAVEQRRLTAAEAFEISRIDEAFQASQWGVDAEAARRTERSRAEARTIDLWFDALAVGGA
jgi:chaperone required for assembly of F1-ATPase